MIRTLLVVGVLALAGLALWRPVSHPAVLQSASGDAVAPPDPSVSASASLPGRKHRHRRDTGLADAGSVGAIIVYVVGAVRKPGLYHVRPSDRVADAVALAGGLTPSADPAGINLAAHVADGDEIDAPLVGQSVPPSIAKHRAHRRTPATQPPSASIDLNTASATELARVPGLGHAVAQRIVELRERDGDFTSFDELLDVAGMTQTRLERAQPFLQPL